MDFTNQQVYELKARLYDMEMANKRNEDWKKESACKLNEAEALIDELRGQLNTVTNTATRRADMLRDLISDNRRLNRQIYEIHMKKSQPELTKEVIDEMSRVLKRHLDQAVSENQPVQSFGF